MDVIDKAYRYYFFYKGEKGVIGKTLLGKDIFYIKVSKTDYPVIISTASIHAREYITTYLSLKLIDGFIKHGKVGTVYFIPLINVDGVRICLDNKPLYKANARGVDLNVNFDAKFGKGEKNVFTAGDENYVGEFPFSEPETLALRDFTYKIKPHATISFHSKGEEIYWRFFQKEPNLERDYKIAKKLAKTTGYRLRETPNSAGGYKDWCVSKLNIPSFTVEVGNDNLSHPIGEKDLREIYKKNKKIIITLSESL